MGGGVWSRPKYDHEILEQPLKMRSNIFKGKGCQGNREVVRVAMKYKLRDANYTVCEITRKRDSYRREKKSGQSPQGRSSKLLVRKLKL